jgi:hypothetical protein
VGFAIQPSYPDQFSIGFFTSTTSRRIEINRNRNAGIIGGINGLQGGGKELVFQESEKC